MRSHMSLEESALATRPRAADMKNSSFKQESSLKLALPGLIAIEVKVLYDDLMGLRTVRTVLLSFYSRDIQG